MSIENPNLAHFRHFSSLFTNLPAYKAAPIFVPIRHYICRGFSTNQLLFMQNKPILSDAQMNVSKFKTMNYKNLSRWRVPKTNPIKPNSNPIQTQFKPNLRNAQNECKYLLYKGIQQ